MDKWTIYLIPQNPILFTGEITKSILLADSYQKAKEIALSIYPGYNIYNC
tara:strand:+ start:1245 stop:1394 length:150 start_codon:yes stop_codon:yes gene_type:complete